MRARELSLRRRPPNDLDRAGRELFSGSRRIHFTSLLLLHVVRFIPHWPASLPYFRLRVRASTARSTHYVVQTSEITFPSRAVCRAFFSCLWSRE
ncbi:hypothetical protein EVAR_2332_1 [Eumeta japonica]|uniref:Uncharacterized protein n=1 Tax=Eumeta variegata TaxID=151549 RepID=A0A4C1SFZ0_EUMVA|nr:hypothetical protein EVAR_2332_1 [Eumeta japonica]